MHEGSDTNVGSDSGWQDSYRTAQMVTLPDVRRVCGVQAGQLVRNLAKGVGCPQEYVLMPLLACCAALMGPRSEVRVHAAWSEPLVLWGVIGARTGTRKSAALRQVLTPLLSLSDDMREQHQMQQRQAKSRSCDSGDESMLDEELRVPILCTGAPTLQNLRCLAQDTEGRLLQVTERAEDSHRRLGIHPKHLDQLSCAQLVDLYEGFPGEFTPTSEHFHSSNSNQGQGQNSAYPSLGVPLPRTVCFNHCGFADPEYVVTLTIKSPRWLSSRFLVSCPSTADCSPTCFAAPQNEENSGGKYSIQHDHTGNNNLTLKDVYQRLAVAHARGSHQYTFSEDAIRELRRFQEEEWSTILAQLDSEEHGGVVSKSLGHVVRLAGVLKALSNAAKSACAAMEPLNQDSDDEFDPDKDVEIGAEDLAGALELGKYFLEQKLSMTFMVNAGLIRAVSGSAQNQQEQQQTLSSPLANSHHLNNMVPPLIPGQVGPMVGVGGAGGSMGLPLGLQGFHPILGMTGAGQQLRLPTGHPSAPMTPQQQQTQQFFPGTSQNRHHLSLLPHPPSSSASPVPTADVDMTQLPATWTPGPGDEDLAELSHTAEFVQLEPTQFVALHARRVKRLLECFDDGCGVSATTAAQKSIAPPVRVAGTNNRHPAWASALFFQKVGDLGLGSAEQVRHPTNGRVYWRFKRKPLMELTDKNIQLLQYLRVDMVRYARMGQPSLPIPGLDAGEVSPAGSLGDAVGGSGGGDEASNASSRGESPAGPDIKQEM